MREQLLLLIRISKPEYNKTLYDEYALFMNPQRYFKNNTLTEGQYDKFEGAITNIPGKLLYSMDDKKTWKLLGNTGTMYKENNAYIFCMYGLKYNPATYDAEQNKYYHVIPWKYIQSLWQGEGTEMIVVKNTKVFIKKFLEAADKANLSHAYGKVHYDLDEKLSNMEYYESVMKDSFESIFHKMRKEYEIQQECKWRKPAVTFAEQNG